MAGTIARTPPRVGDGEAEADRRALSFDMLAACGYSTLHAVVMAHPLELLDKSRLFDSEVQEAILHAASRLAPRPTTALLMRRQPARKLATGFSALDAALDGGLQGGTTTEIVGPSAAGKTQLCLQATATTLLTDEASLVVYVDVDHTFSAHRLATMLGERGGASQERVRRCLARVVVLRPLSCDLLLETATRLADWDGAEALLIIDSISALPRAEYSRALGADRHAFLAQMSALLKERTARQGSVALVTNDMQAQLPGRAGHGLTDWDETAAIPSLGVTWAHNINYRISLRPAGMGGRCSRGAGEAVALLAHIAKSPTCDNATIAFSIGAAGLHEASEAHQPHATV